MAITWEKKTELVMRRLDQKVYVLIPNRWLFPDVIDKMENWCREYLKNQKTYYVIDRELGCNVQKFVFLSETDRMLFMINFTGDGQEVDD